MPDALLFKYKIYPRMTRWFNPLLLMKLLNNVIVSKVFGQYADRRLIVAALDTVDLKTHMARTGQLKSKLTPDANGAIWIDWIADLGDGFDSTYAMASLLAQRQLTVSEVTLPRGQALIMGGDQVYPTATKEAYRNHLVQPYRWAFPDHDPKSDDGVPVFAIPGNHDWYDGLVLFLAFFCREKRLHLGSWRSQQRRSYFALELAEGWWIWAMDIQLADDMDQPQYDYFKIVAEKMPDSAKIILCGAEPGWLYVDVSDKSWQIMDLPLCIARDENRGFRFPLLLSGDTHHYSRYSSEDGTQFITSGGGGAFLHPTHQLADQVTVKWTGIPRQLSLTTSPDASHTESTERACYPPQSVSRKLVWRNLWFALTNWDFSIFMGFMYWAAAIGLTLRPQPDAVIIVGLIFSLAIVGYTFFQEQSYRPTVVISSLLHALAHVAAIVVAARFFGQWNAEHLHLNGHWYSVWEWLGVLALEMLPVGFFVGGTLFGLNLIVTCRWLRMNRNDAFSALRLNRFNNFLRMRIQANTLEVYAIGLQDVPKRSGWSANPKKASGNPDQPVFTPDAPLAPHLIEKVVIETSHPPTRGAAKLRAAAQTRKSQRR